MDAASLRSAARRAVIAVGMATVVALFFVFVPTGVALAAVGFALEASR